MFEEKCFGCTPSQKKTPKWKETRLYGACKSLAQIFCVALVQLAGSSCSTVMHQMVQKISCCSFGLPKSSFHMDASKIICCNSQVLRLICNTKCTWILSLHGLPSCQSPSTALILLYFLIFLIRTMSHHFFSVPSIVKTLIYSLKLVNKLKGKNNQKNHKAFESTEKLILLSMVQTESEDPSEGEELRKIYISPENTFSSSGKVV